ncbi:hypothetical protein LPB03_09235 [Polaribacter vadi]|uniref:Uncharacterized protein n=2 Tax=Polaribacter vadi TaxID=1774273 RepID=A0A1B8U3M5_9FLAO|nr:hypothetical protein LPB03_09235 [Polaribacter vadi]OBY66475.1 hypothetical protein LPB3_00300 [Polaribacter vadi]
MNLLNTNIYKHDTDVDKSHKLNTTELSNWLMQLRFIKEELKILIELCSNSLNKKNINDEEILLEFEKKNQENDHLLSILHKYMSIREHIAECEDTQCDTTYLNEHKKHKETYLQHMDSYRKLKDQFYVDVHKQLNLNNNC